MAASILVPSGAIAPFASNKFTLVWPSARETGEPQDATSVAQFQTLASSLPTVAHKNGTGLLDALWRSPELTHQIGAIDRQTGRFRNISVRHSAQAILFARDLSDAGIDAFFACAEYLTPNSRTAANVSGAWGLWMDIDCGAEKAAAGKGYPTLEDARQALACFCGAAGLTEPTHIVSSGGGLHVYWALCSMIDRGMWQGYAAKLDRITKVLGFLADHSRTADAASVLRLPGTLNHKYNPPRPVTLLYESATFIQQRAMLDAIDGAYARLCPATYARTSNPLARVCVPVGAVSADGRKYGPPNLTKLASALTALHPDCDEDTWKLRRIAPLARTAGQHPDCREAIYKLAKSWSSGELCGVESLAWRNPGGNGLTGEEVFDDTWRRFLNSNYDGIPITLGTIYYDARLAGWEGYIDPADRFEIISDEDGEAA